MRKWIAAIGVSFSACAVAVTPNFTPMMTMNSPDMPSNFTPYAMNSIPTPAGAPTPTAPTSAPPTGVITPPAAGATATKSTAPTSAPPAAAITPPPAAATTTTSSTAPTSAPPAAAITPPPSAATTTTATTTAPTPAPPATAITPPPTAAAPISTSSGPVTTFSSSAPVTTTTATTTAIDSTTTTTTAAVTPPPAKPKFMRKVFALTLGEAFSQDLGESKYFASGYSGTSSYYSYVAHHASRSVAVWGGFAGLEFCLHPLLFWQIGPGYYQTGSFNAKGIVTQGDGTAPANRYTYRYNISSQQLMLENKFLYNKGNYHPYVYAGLGEAWNKASAFVVNIIPPFSNVSNQFTNKTFTSVTYSLGFGLDYEFNTNVRLGLGYRFIDFGRVSLGDATIGTIKTSNELSQSHMYTQELLAQFMFLL